MSRERIKKVGDFGSQRVSEVRVSMGRESMGTVKECRETVLREQGYMEGEWEESK